MDIEKIIKHDPKKTIENLFEKFKTKDIDEIYVEMISKYLFPIEDIKKLMIHVKVHGTFLDLVEKYLMKRSDRTFGIFFSSLVFLYDLKPSLSDLKRTHTLVKKVKDKVEVDISDAVEYLKTYIGELEYAPKPPWVSIKEGENRSLLTDIPASRVGLGTEEKRYKELLDESTNLFFSFVPSSSEKVNFGDGEKMVKDKIPLDIRKTVQNYLSTVSGLDRSDEDSARVRIFGPQNRFMDKHCPYNLNGIGPCRMLNCYCRGGGDPIEDASENDVEWFTGRCDVCNRKILDKSWAVRYPYKDGGWNGVYCSFKCLESAEYYEGEENFDQYVRMENLRESLLSIGIMDRTKV